MSNMMVSNNLNATSNNMVVDSDGLTAHVKSSFKNMLVSRITGDSAPAICDMLCVAVAKKAAKDNLTGQAAINEFKPGKIMRVLTSFTSEDLPANYNQMIEKLAVNHLTTNMTPKQNVESVLGGASVQFGLHPTYGHAQAKYLAVAGAPGVGKSTYEDVLGPHVNTSTDTYANILADVAVQKFGIAPNKDPYQISGLEGSLVKRMVVDELNKMFQNHNSQLPNISVSVVRFYGTEFEGIFKSNVPQVNAAIVFCDKDTALAHMEQRKAQGLHFSPENTILNGMMDASNQLFSNQYMGDAYKKKYTSVVDYLRQECRNNYKPASLDIISTDPISGSQYYLNENQVDGKSFFVVGRVNVDATGKATLQSAEDSKYLAAFLAQSNHTIEDLNKQLA